MKKICYLLCLALLMSGCADTKKIAPKEGRIAVQTNASHQLKQANTTIQTTPVLSVSSWQQPNANVANLMPHGKVAENVKKVWSRNVGKGISSDYHYLPEPIIVQDVIYALDGAFQLSAVDIQTGKTLWKQQLPTNKEMSMASIGLTSDGKNLYIANGNGMVYATDLTGKIIWEHNTQAILRSEPAVAEGYLYILSGNNQLFVLRTNDGSPVWQYQNIVTDTNLFGMGQPAIHKGVAVVPFSNGDIIAFDARSGMVLWSDSLLSYRTFNQINDLSHILASPVIEGNTVYLVGNAQKTGAYDLKTGRLHFMQDIGGQSTPLINGNALFMVTSENTLVALDKTKGTLIWEKALESKEMKGIAWKGPVLANNQLILVSNKGDILFVDALSGEIKQKTSAENLSNKPVLGADKMILYTDKANLIAYQ